MAKGKRWTEADLFDLSKKGLKITEVGKKAQDTEEKPPKSHNKCTKPAPDEPVALQHIKMVLMALQLQYVTEYRFHPVRRFRFDIALMQHKVAVEYEGLMSAKSRHTSVKGYTHDGTKYNLAQIEGWRVLRYTALNYEEFAGDIQNMLKI